MRRKMKRGKLGKMETRNEIEDYNAVVEAVSKFIRCCRAVQTPSCLPLCQLWTIFDPPRNIL